MICHASVGWHPVLWKPYIKFMKDTVFKLSRVSGAPVSNEELLADLRRIFNLNTGCLMSRKAYKELGGIYGTTVYHDRFGSWNKALAMVGIPLAHEINISDQRLFENILILWQHHGKQPSRTQLSSSLSKISQGPYNRRFGSWGKALEAFVNYANSSDAELKNEENKIAEQRKTGRDPSLRLRWRVLQRDRFTCCSCGKSPAITLGIELHVDHIKPWSKGGDTVIDNLQTLCSGCNLGKSNLMD